MSTSGVASPYAGTYFTGMSSYSEDLNNAVARAVAIASLPIQILQNNASALSSQQTELNALNNNFTAVQSAISTLASSSTRLTATVGDSTVATATLGASATAGSYTLEVDNLGSYSDALSTDALPAVTDPTTQNISPAASFTLTVAGATTTITPSGTSLNALASAINAANAGVEAAVVNVSSTATADYRLSLQSSQYGKYDIQLNDGTGDLLASSTTGAAVQYTVDGKPVSSGSRTATLAPGVTLNLTGTNVAEPTTVTVAQNTTGVASALQSFVSAYNAAAAELAKNRGQNGGALAGESIVYRLNTALQGLANYNGGSGQIPSLVALGVTFNDTSGQLSFNPSTFDAATSGQGDALAAFLGSATGGGFLETATNALAGIEGPTIGILTQDLSSVESQITSNSQQVAAKTAQAQLLQQNLTKQMSEADALIYSLQQQQTYFQEMFAAQTANNTAGLA